MRSRRSDPRLAYTALQLVVVMAIILAALAFMMPAIERIRALAAQNESLNNLRQLALGMHSHHDAYKVFPPAVGEFAGHDGPAHFHILPYLEQQPLYQSGDGASWKNGVYGTVVPIFLDPRDSSSPDFVYKNWLATTNYAVNWMIAKEGKMRIQNITDGTSNTLMFAQRYQMCNGQPTAWGYPSIFEWAPMFGYFSNGMFQSNVSQDRCDPQLPQAIGRDILVAMCDGSARSFPHTLTPQIWYYLTDPNDGNPLPLDVFD